MKVVIAGMPQYVASESAVTYFVPDALGPVPAYQEAYEAFKNDEDILCYMHNDVEIHDENWALRVSAEFVADPNVAIVGFGGAVGIGTSELYKRRYDIWQLQRVGYRSNQRDWKTHGLHEEGSCDVAVVDGFFMAVRMEFLRKIGGWKWFPFQFHVYDLGLCLMAHRHGWKVRMVGVDCTHHGGGTSITEEYRKRCREHGTTPELEHQLPHAWMYKEFRDVLPVRVG